MAVTIVIENEKLVIMFNKKIKIEGIFAVIEKRTNIARNRIKLFKDGK